jgi:hypothetical protein
MPQPVDSDKIFSRGPDGKLTPHGQAERWTMEFQAARDRLKKWHGQGEKILDRFLDERDKGNVGESRLNLFTSNVESQHAMLYGQTPKSTVSRVFGDAQDDVARVAGEMLSRLINPKDGDDFTVALAYALEDRLLPGFGFACLRYEVETEPATDEATGEPIADEAGQPVEKKTREAIGADYHYWKSVLWSPCRTFEEARWVAWSSPLTKADLKARFGEDVAGLIPMNAKTGRKGDPDAVKADPWARADVWEIWCKEDRTVYWFVEGYERILDEKPDPIGLSGFYPFPKPMIARPTTRSYVPRPDFVIAQDLYDEIDKLSTRIKLLEDAVRVAGVYDKSSTEVVKLLSEAGFNKLYPSESFALFREKGGMAGAVDWLPLDQIVAAIGVLTEKRAEKIALLQQVTGWSDIMRGQSNPNETLGAQKLKTRFGGVRVERFQREVARFATDLLKIKAEIVALHFDEQTIIEQSNIAYTELVDDPAAPGKKIPNMPLIQEAAKLIKGGASKFRIEVKPEAISLTDFAQMKEERVETATVLVQLISAAPPFLQAVGPHGAQLILEIGRYVMAATKGAAGLEGVFDQFIEKAQQAAAQPKPPPPPDPKLEATKVKAQVDVQKAGMDLQVAKVKTGLEMQKMQAEVQANRANAAVRVMEAQAAPRHMMEDMP